MNTLKAARYFRRSMLPVALICAAFLFYNFGRLKVIPGMDTMTDSMPIGTTCIVKKRPSRVVVGNVVFVDLEAGGTLLSQVARVEVDGFYVRHENLDSLLPQGETLGKLPFSSVRGIVIVSLIP